MTQTKFYTAKIDRIFKAVFLSEEGPDLMKSLLENILEKEVKILSYPPCNIPVKNAWEKVTTVDFIVELEGKIIHLEVETGNSIETRAKNFTGFTKIYNQNAIRGKKYDTETLFLHIDLQYGLGEKNEFYERYAVRNENGKKKYIKNFEILVINMDKAKMF